MRNNFAASERQKLHWHSSFFPKLRLNLTHSQFLSLWAPDQFSQVGSGSLAAFVNSLWSAASATRRRRSLSRTLHCRTFWWIFSFCTVCPRAALELVRLNTPRLRVHGTESRSHRGGSGFSSGVNALYIQINWIRTKAKGNLNPD